MIRARHHHVKHLSIIWKSIFNYTFFFLFWLTYITQDAEFKSLNSSLSLFSSEKREWELFLLLKKIHIFILFFWLNSTLYLLEYFYLSISLNTIHVENSHFFLSLSFHFICITIIIFVVYKKKTFFFIDFPLFLLPFFSLQLLRHLIERMY